MFGIELLLKQFSITPESLREHAQQAGALLSGVQAQLNRIEKNQLVIMAKLGVEIVTETESPAQGQESQGANDADDNGRRQLGASGENAGAGGSSVRVGTDCARALPQ